MKNITSREDVFPFPRSFLDHLNRRTKIKLRCRCFVNFFCGDAVFVIFFCGVAVLAVPQCPPLNWHICDPQMTFLLSKNDELKYENFETNKLQKKLRNAEQRSKPSIHVLTLSNILCP